MAKGRSYVKRAPTADRTYAGVVYASKAEAVRASDLDQLKRCGLIRKWERQVPVQLGEDFATKVDFVVWDDDGVHAEEVKGFENERFKIIKRLWRKYGPYPLVVMKLGWNKWTKEVFEGKQ